MAMLYRREGAGSAATPGDHPSSDITIAQIVQQRLVSVQFQPIVWLDNSGTVAFEAYARGPAGTSFASPKAMFEQAAVVGLTAELDQTAHAAAYQAAIDARLHPSLSLFVNADPSGIGTGIDPALTGVFAVALSKLRILIEISEQDIAGNPAAALAGIARARACGWGISWDHLGATPDSLALMPFVQPDVVKLDVSLVHDRFHPEAARIVNAVIAYAEQTGASILATGIETKEHLATARGMGARIGQGYLFGRPGDLPRETTAPGRAVPLMANHETTHNIATPYEIFTAQAQTANASMGMIEQLARHLEQRCSIDPEPAVLLKSLPTAQLMSGGPIGRLQTLARSAAFVGVVLGEEADYPMARVRTAQMHDNDPLRNEWNMAVVGPHFAALLTARGNEGVDDPNEAVSYALTYNRSIVLQAARILLQRFTQTDLQRS